MDRISPNSFNAIAEDEEVKRRVDELMVANLQVRAREASLQGDWNRVEQIIMQGKKIAGENEWLQNSSKRVFGTIDDIERGLQLSQIKVSILQALERCGF